MLNFSTQSQGKTENSVILCNIYRHLIFGISWGQVWDFSGSGLELDFSGSGLELCLSNNPAYARTTQSKEIVSIKRW